MKRNEKVKYLQELMSGKRKLSELKKPVYTIKIFDGIYKNDIRIDENETEMELYYQHQKHYSQPQIIKVNRPT
jgi:hypothetical protein